MSTTTSDGPLKSLGRIDPSEVAALFLEDWELGRVALSCHMAMDLLCQELRDACWVSSEPLGSTPFTVIAVPERLSCGTVTATEASLSPRREMW